MNLEFKDVALLVDMITQEQKEENKKIEENNSRINIEKQNKSIINRLVKENSLIRSKIGG